MKKPLKIFLLIILAVLFAIFVHDIIQEIQYIEIAHSNIIAYNLQIDKFQNTYLSTIVDYSETIEMYKKSITSCKRAIFDYILNIIKYCIFLILIVFTDFKLLPISKIKRKMSNYLKCKRKHKIQKLQQKLNNLKDVE